MNHTRAHTALLLSVMLASAVGCGERSIDSVAEAAEPTVIRIAPSEPTTTEVAAPVKTEPSTPATQPAAPVLAAPVLAAPAQVEPAPAEQAAEPAPVATEPATAATEPAPAATEPAAAPQEAPAANDELLLALGTPAPQCAGIPNVAVGPRTAIGQATPQELQDQWHAKLTDLATSDASFRLVDDPTQADWWVEVAALERPDVIYLAPTKRLVEQPDDDYLRMSPPGDAAVEWLRMELGNLMCTSELVRIQVELDAADVVVQDRAAKQQTTESARSPAAPRSSAPTEPSGGSAPGFLDKSLTRSFSIFTREGPAEDLKAVIVQEQSGIYHTANRTQALLGTYGKMTPGNKFFGRPAKYEQRTVMQEIDSVRRFVTLERQGKGGSSDFLSFAGTTRQAWQLIDLAGQVGGGRTNEVAFDIVGMRLDQSDVIRALNQDPEALNYFDYLQSNGEVPCLILENLVFTSYSATQGTSLTLGGSAHTILTGDGGGADYERQRESTNQFSSPIVRAYQMYQVRLNRGQVVDLVYVDP